MEGESTLNIWTDKLKTLPLNKFHLVSPLILLVPALLFSDSLYGIFGEANYVGVHLVIEIFLIVASFAIAIQTWLIFPFILSNQRIYIGALFLFVGLIEIAHTLAYKGMPYFILESSSYSATWFYMISRITQALGLLLILTVKQRKINETSRWYAYVASILLALSCIFVIYYPTPLLPPLVIEGQGLAPLKIILQFLAIVFQIILIIYLVFNYQKARTRNTIMIFASLYLILSDSMFTTYKSVYDIRNFIGHLFQIVGYYYLMRSLYYSSVEKPFKDLMQTQNELESSVISLEETKEQLEKSEAELHYLAYHDELTQLPNARSLSEQLTEHILNSPQRLAVMMLEIDRFTAFKESLGISFLDTLLKKVAERLRNILPKEIFISKLREREYTIVFKNIDNIEQVESICFAIQEAMKAPIEIQHFSLNCSLNIGVAMYPQDGDSEDELLKQAQIAMREAHKETKRFKFYDPTMEKALMESLILEQDLHHALDKQEIYLEYQPKIDISTGCIDSVEALVRWRHPEKGVISPMLFVPIAEESGLIVPIGEWVLEQACLQAKSWQANGFSNLGVGVNLSIRQFYQQDLVEMVDRVLQKTQLDPQYLELEITESMTMNTNYAITILNQLKALGVKIAVDDFGTGYSSLSYLKDFPIDCLKIDRSFVNNINEDKHGTALISMIISMAKHLELKVVAEGVEDAQQLAFLAERNCNLIQGYLFSKPLPVDVLSDKFQDIQNHAYALIGTNSEENK